MKFFKRKQRDTELFRTHTPWAFEVGDVLSSGDKTYIITRVEPLAPTLLLDGGSAPCSCVYGRLRLAS